MKKASMVLILWGVAMAGGCAGESTAPRGDRVEGPPPPNKVELVPQPPSADAVWVKGRWERMWVAAHQQNEWVWVAGHWK